jgi:hypothetical protein
VLWRALDAAVARFARRHPGRPVVVFCRADCWMSWNVARRLARLWRQAGPGERGPLRPSAGSMKGSRVGRSGGNACCRQPCSRARYAVTRHAVTRHAVNCLFCL